MNDAPPKSVGLGGDGDEIHALEDVEQAFGVKLDYSDAKNWHTAGDVFLSLCRALPANVRDDNDVWVRFTEALAYQTGVDPEGIEKDSPLMSKSRFWAQFANASAGIWIIIGTGMLALVVWALL